MQTGESEVMYRGDAEAGLAVTIADRWDRGRGAGRLPRCRRGAGPLSHRRARRGTDRLLAIGTGDGQTDVELRGMMDLGSGNFGVRLEGGYNRQLAADVADRVAPPPSPSPPGASRPTSGSIPAT